MPEETSRHEQLNTELRVLLGAAIRKYAEENGLTEEEVMRTAQKLLLNPSQNKT